jgi:hypothetical protein
MEPTRRQELAPRVGSTPSPSQRLMDCSDRVTADVLHSWTEPAYHFYDQGAAAPAEPTVIFLKKDTDLEGFEPPTFGLEARRYVQAKPQVHLSLSTY